MGMGTSGGGGLVSADAYGFAHTRGGAASPIGVPALRSSIATEILGSPTPRNLRLTRLGAERSVRRDFFGAHAMTDARSTDPAAVTSAVQFLMALHFINWLGFAGWNARRARSCRLILGRVPGCWWTGNVAGRICFARC